MKWCFLLHSPMLKHPEPYLANSLAFLFTPFTAETDTLFANRGVNKRGGFKMKALAERKEADQWLSRIKSDGAA